MGKISEYRPALAAFALMISMSITTTALSFFLGPVCEALGLGRGSFTVCYSFLTASGAAAIPVLGQVIHKRGLRGIVALSALWVCTGFCLFSVSGKLWMFYAVSAAMGIFGTACVSLCATVIVQQAYTDSRASGILGVVMSGSGVGGMVLSLFLPGLIEALGWRWGYRILGLFWLILGLSAWILLGKSEISAEERKTTVHSEGVTLAQALRTPKLYLLTLVMFMLSAACGIQTQLPVVLSGYGFGTAQVSAMVSFFTAALAAGKIAQGILYCKIGPRRGGGLIVAVFAVSFLLLRVPDAAYPALAILAVGMGSVTTLMPIVARSAFGSREYAAIWSILSTASNLGTLIAAPLFGLAYDRAGSYEDAMLISSLGLTLSLILLYLSFRKA